MMAGSLKKRNFIRCFGLLLLMVAGAMMLFAGCNPKIGSINADDDTVQKYLDELKTYECVRDVAIFYSREGAFFNVRLEDDVITDEEAAGILEKTDQFVNEEFYEQLSKIQKRTFAGEDISHRVMLRIACDDYSYAEINGKHISYHEKRLCSYMKEYTSSSWKSLSVN